MNGWPDVMPRGPYHVVDCSENGRYIASKDQQECLSGKEMVINVDDLTLEDAERLVEILNRLMSTVSL